MSIYYDRVRDGLEEASQYCTRCQEKYTKADRRKKFERIRTLVDTMRHSVAKDGTITPSLEKIAEETSIPIHTLKGYLYTLTTLTGVPYRFGDGYMTQGRRNIL